MPTRLHQFVKGLHDNPLFVREWRRVIGPWHMFAFRMVVISLLLFGVLEIFLYLRPWLLPVRLHNYAMRFVQIVFLSAFFNPPNWLVTLLAWWSIDVEHRRGRANMIALTRLTSQELFWAKTVPTVAFSAGAIWTLRIVTHLYVIIVQPIPGSILAWLGSTIIAPIPFFTSIMVCYALMLKWPSLRRGGVVVPAALFISGFIEAAVAFAPFKLHRWFSRSFLYANYLWIDAIETAVKLAAMIGIAWLLAKIVAPRFRGLLTSEAPRFPFVLLLRARVKVRRMWRGARTWTGR